MFEINNASVIISWGIGICSFCSFPFLLSPPPPPPPVLFSLSPTLLAQLFMKGNQTIHSIQAAPFAGILLSSITRFRCLDSKAAYSVGKQTNSNIRFGRYVFVCASACARTRVWERETKGGREREGGREGERRKRERRKREKTDREGTESWRWQKQLKKKLFWMQLPCVSFIPVTLGIKTPPKYTHHKISLNQIPTVVSFFHCLDKLATAHNYQWKHGMYLNKPGMYVYKCCFYVGVIVFFHPCLCRSSYEDKMASKYVSQGYFLLFLLPIKAHKRWKDECFLFGQETTVSTFTAYIPQIKQQMGTVI